MTKAERLSKDDFAFCCEEIGSFLDGAGPEWEKIKGHIDALEAQLAQRDTEYRLLVEKNYRTYTMYIETVAAYNDCLNRSEQKDERIRKLRNVIDALPDIWGDKRSFAVCALAADAKGEGK